VGHSAAWPFIHCLQIGLEPQSAGFCEGREIKESFTWVRAHLVWFISVITVQVIERTQEEYCCRIKLLSGEILFQSCKEIFCVDFDYYICNLRIPEL